MAAVLLIVLYLCSELVLDREDPLGTVGGRDPTLFLANDLRFFPLAVGNLLIAATSYEYTKMCKSLFARLCIFILCVRDQVVPDYHSKNKKKKDYKF